MMGATDAAGNPELIAIIRAEIMDAGGRISFARYMEFALAHPVYGYYASGRGAPGREGADFLTAPETSPYFGRCLAVQVAECWYRLGTPAHFTIWEPGAGAGTLARTLLDALRELDADAYAATTYWLDDLSPPSLDRASDALRAHITAGRIASGAPETGFVGVILSNEFVDTFPVHRVRMHNERIEEQFVRWDDVSQSFGVEWVKPAAPAFAEYFAASDVSLVEGQIAEVCLAVTPWVEAIAHRISQGYVITIDYGDTADALYRPSRFPDGSLMCYHHHTANREPLKYIGEQDMTAHVDFSALMRTGVAAGLTTLGLTTQAAFLTSLGLGEMLYEATQAATDAFRYINERNAVIRLIEPSAMGRNRMLLQGKHVPTDPPLRGLIEPPI